LRSETKRVPWIEGVWALVTGDEVARGVSDSASEIKGPVGIPICVTTLEAVSVTRPRDILRGARGPPQGPKATRRPRMSPSLAVLSLLPFGLPQFPLVKVCQALSFRSTSK
jgi:hypothetical protein